MSASTKNNGLHSNMPFKQALKHITNCLVCDKEAKYTRNIMKFYTRATFNIHAYLFLDVNNLNTWIMHVPSDNV